MFVRLNKEGNPANGNTVSILGVHARMSYGNLYRVAYTDENGMYAETTARASELDGFEEEGSEAINWDSLLYVGRVQVYDNYQDYEFLTDDPRVLIRLTYDGWLNNWYALMFSSEDGDSEYTEEETLNEEQCQLLVSMVPAFERPGAPTYVFVLMEQYPVDNHGNVSTSVSVYSTWSLGLCYLNKRVDEYVMDDNQYFNPPSGSRSDGLVRYDNFSDGVSLVLEAVRVEDS